MFKGGKFNLKYFVSIVSHGHYDFIHENLALLAIAKLPNVSVLVKDNIHDPALASFCRSNDIVYLTSESRMGFGENNNFVYEFCCTQLGIEAEDYFLTINPDVVISSAMFTEMTIVLAASAYPLFAINLFKDHKFDESEASLRKFPSWGSLVNLLIKVPVCSAYDKEQLANFSEVNWASGAFLGFKSSLYQKLKGFDARYFMYYEDVDICFRAKHHCDVGVHFLKEIKAVHVGAYQNRNVFSKHFRWYISSLCKFLIRKSFFGK